MFAKALLAALLRRLREDDMFLLAEALGFPHE